MPRQTLSDRVKGRRRKRGAQSAHQLLSVEQEATLVDWIDHRALTAKPLDRHAVQALVFELCGHIPGKNWLRRFEKRHPELKLSRPSNLDPKRAQNFNRTNVEHFYGLLKRVFDAHPNFPSQHIWNMDEKGLQLGGGRKRCKKYFHMKEMKKKNFFRVRSDNLELVTVIECISPSGLTIPPSFVLSAGPTPALDDLDVPIGAVATSPNGWTDNELGAAWFEHTFLPFAAAHRQSDAPILLFLDGHDSHETDGLRKLAFEHNVIIIAFPSKCTHKLQPLDVVVFAQTQRHWANHCDRRIYENIPMTRYNVIQEYMKVRSASMTPELCRSAFSCTGIYPFKADIFTEEDFAPAKSFSTSKHVPRTFPSEAPSSSPLPSDLSDLDCSSSGDDDSTSEDSEQVHEWDLDSDDDPDYEPPSVPTTVEATSRLSSPDHMSSLASASCPTHPSEPLSSAPAMLPTSATLPASATPLATGASSDAVSLGPELETASQSAASRYFTRSQKHSSPAVSVSVALDRSQAPIPSSVEEMGSEINRLRMTVNLMEKELLQAKAEAAASNAHCTIMARAATDAKAELEQQKRKTRRSVKTSARYVTHPTIRARWAADQEERAQRAREAAQKEAQRSVDDAARNAQIHDDIQTKIFTGALHWQHTIQT